MKPADTVMRRVASACHSVLDYARAYCAKGWSPIPIPFGTKGPVLPAWQNLKLNEEDLPRHFSGEANIGLLLGAASQGLIDIDLDAPEAIAAADVLLPPTKMIHGRLGKPRSHRWYVLVGALPKTKRYQDADGTCLVELCSSGGQTVVPPSVHPSGEKVEWVEQEEAAHVVGDVITKAVAKTAGAALLARHWPKQGSRQDCAMALAGALLRAGWCIRDASVFIGVVARVAGDEEAVKREQCVGHAAERLAAQDTVTGLPRLKELLGLKPVSRFADWLDLRLATGDDHTNASNPVKSTAVTKLLELISDVELFHTPEGDAYANVPVKDHHETLDIRSTGFARWLSRAFYNTHKTAVPAQALVDFQKLLEARALYDGPECPVFLRVAQFDGAYYIDLCNESWEVIEITSVGWKVIVQSPVRFRRTHGMRPLPHPLCDGSIYDLRPFVNVADDDSFRLILAWVLAALRPSGPYPILMLLGEQGSAKSTTARVLRLLIDPSISPLRGVPREERDFMIGAKNTHIVALDNLSSLSQCISDALCRLATGGGYAMRALYTNDEEILLNVQRPAILNGIDDIVTRHDLIDRVLSIQLPSIPEEGRKDEETFWEAFELRRPYIFGALLDAMSETLGRINETRLVKPPRMADFARFGTAAEIALGWEPGGFMAAYGGNHLNAIEDGLDAHSIAQAIRSLINKCGQWKGEAGDLLRELGDEVSTDVVDSKSWPKSAQDLGRQLSRLIPALRAVGIDVRRDKEGHERRRIIIIQKREG